MTSSALRRLLAIAAISGVLLTGAACGSDDTTMTPSDKTSQMTDDMSKSPMTEKSDSMMDDKSESPMTDKSDGMMTDK